jgi:hypothetical protein
MLPWPATKTNPDLAGVSDRDSCEFHPEIRWHVSHRDSLDVTSRSHTSCSHTKRYFETQLSLSLDLLYTQSARTLARTRLARCAAAAVAAAAAAAAF